MYRTQKAQGVSVLSYYPRWTPLPAIVLTTPDQAFSPLEQTQIDWWTSRTGLFARPCPVHPAHGFVESRRLAVVTPGDIREQIATIWQETQAADPLGEILITPYLPSQLNFIWRPGVMTIGPDHDGATAGRDSISIPCPLPAIDEFRHNTVFRRMLHDARITEEPYVEAVALKTQQVNPLTGHFIRKDDTAPIIVTQLRNGPAGSITPDFVPTEMTVAAVVQTNGEDLLEWKARVEGLAPGTAVYHPGGNCNDHYFVHCRVNHVPILTTRLPRVGETLVPTEGTPAPYDAKACLRGIVTGLVADLNEAGARRWAVGAISQLLHSAGHIGGRDAYWLGIAAMLMTRLGYAAALGEYRHSFRSGEWRAMSRDQVYEELLADYFAHRGQVEQAWASFFYGKWSSSYGGEAWARCTYETIQLETAMLALIKTPTPDAVSALITQLNITVNLAHNNGWWLNKFATKDIFDDSATGEPTHLFQTSRFLYDAHQQSHAARTTWLDTLRRFRRVTPLQPHRATKVALQPEQRSVTPAQLLGAFAQPDVRARLVPGDRRMVHLQVLPTRAYLTETCGYTPAEARQIASTYWRINIVPATTSKVYDESATVTMVGEPDLLFDAIYHTLEAHPEPTIPSASGSGAIYRAITTTIVQEDDWLRVRLVLTETQIVTLTLPVATFLDYAKVALRSVERDVPMVYHAADVDIVRERYGLLLTGDLIMQKPDTTDTDENDEDDDDE